MIGKLLVYDFITSVLCKRGVWAFFAWVVRLNEATISVCNALTDRWTMDALDERVVIEVTHRHR